jgi:hypothetical protein
MPLMPKDIPVELSVATMINKRTNAGHQKKNSIITELKFLAKTLINSCYHVSINPFNYLNPA